MDGKSDLLKEAIADAKAVKETALANAKIALEEAFAPRIEAMLSTKLSEDLYEDEMEDEVPAPVADTPVEEHDVMYEPEVEGGEMDAAPAPEMDAEIDMDMPAEEPVVADDMEMEGMMDDAPVDTDSVEEDLELEAIIRELEEDLNEEELTEEDIFESNDSTDLTEEDKMVDDKKRNQ